MAQNNLRYYRGQYNPSSQSSYSPDIISMYRPEEEMILSEAARGRQQRFDVGKASISQEIARIGDLDTVDYEQMKNRLSDFEEKVNTTIQDKYSGDYGAGANEIAKLIAKERAHPFYTYNKQKVKAAETIQEDKRRIGAGFMTTKDPLEVSYTDWKNGEDFSYTPVDRQQIVSQSMNLFQNFAKTMQNDPELLNTKGGQYFLAMMQTGASGPEEVMEFLQTDIGENIVSQITSSPELQQLDQEAVMGAITEGAMSMIGPTKSQFLANQNFQSDYQKAQLLGKQTPGGLNRIVSAGYMNADELGSQINDLNSEFIQSFRNSLMEEMMEDPRYQELQEAGYDNYDKLTAISRRIEPQTQTSLRPSGPGGTAYRVPKDVKEPLSDIQQQALNFKSEFDERLTNILSDEGLLDDATKSRYGIRVYDFNELAGTTTSSISEINNIKKAANNFVKELSSEDLTFMHPRKDKKAYEDMTLDSMNILSFGKNPVGSEFILNIKGEDSEGNPKESRLLLSDQGDIARFISYVSALEPTSEAAQALTYWHAENNGYLDQLLKQTQ